MQGVSRQAVHSRLKRFVETGRLSVQGEGQKRRYHVPTFRALAFESRDPAQATRNHGRVADLVALAESLPAAPPPAAAPLSGESLAPTPDAYATERTALVAADRAIKELKLAEIRRQLIPAGDIEAAASAIATAIKQRLDGFKAGHSALYAAARQAGEEAHRVALLRAVDDLARGIVQDLTAGAATIAA